MCTIPKQEKNNLSEESDGSSLTSPAVRRRSKKYNNQKSPQRKLIEGTFKHTGSINYEEYLAAIGTGPCSQDLVMRAGMVLRIEQVRRRMYLLI